MTLSKTTQTAINRANDLKRQYDDLRGAWQRNTYVTAPSTLKALNHLAAEVKAARHYALERIAKDVNAGLE